MIDFQTSPDRYRHWKLQVDGPIAHLSMDVDPDTALLGGYELKLNSYDLGVDIELYDAVQRLRFEHPQVAAVVIDSLKDRVFCSGANIRMLAKADHAHKVNFCKFTNETRNSIEEATAESGQTYLAAVNGTAAGGGYELALACEEIILIDDGSAAVSLPEVPLLAVLPGTGGLTRLVDKRMVRRDRADVFCTTEEGIRGKRALDWGLVDHLVPGSRFIDEVAARAAEVAAAADRPDAAEAIELRPLERSITDEEVAYPSLTVAIDRELRTATLTLRAPDQPAPDSPDAARALGDTFWPLALCRQVDDAILHLRVNELDIGTLIFQTAGDPEIVAGYDELLLDGWEDDWFLREVMLYWRRALKRLDVNSRTSFAFVLPGSCFVGFLADVLFAVDRTYALEGVLEEGETEARVRITRSNLGPLPMPNGLTRLATRFWGHDDQLAAAQAVAGKDLDAVEAADLGLVTEAFDDIDWDDEIRLILEERAAFSADSLVGLEANLRFPGPETMETKIFGRLSAWQNWIFQRPNAAGDEGALKRYGTGQRPAYDRDRV